MAVDDYGFVAAAASPSSAAAVFRTTSPHSPAPWRIAT
jgi:hypothetical protein